MGCKNRSRNLALTRTHTLPSSDIATSQCVTVSPCLFEFLTLLFFQTLYILLTKRLLEFVSVTVGITCNLMQASVYSVGSSMTIERAKQELGNCFSGTWVYLESFIIKNTVLRHGPAKKPFPPFLFCNGKKTQESDTQIENQDHIHPKIADTRCGR